MKILLKMLFFVTALMLIHPVMADMPKTTDFIPNTSANITWLQMIPAMIVSFLPLAGLVLMLVAAVMYLDQLLSIFRDIKDRKLDIKQGVGIALFGIMFIIFVIFLSKLSRVGLRLS